MQTTKLLINKTLRDCECSPVNQQQLNEHFLMERAGRNYLIMEIVFITKASLQLRILIF